MSDIKQKTNAASSRLYGGCLKENVRCLNSPVRSLGGVTPLNHAKNEQAVRYTK